MNHNNRLQCLRRDNDQCVLTKTGDFNQSTLFACSWALAYWALPESIWSSLGIFWAFEEIEDWKQAVLDEKGTEDCSNLITLSATAHVYRGQALFAIEPIQVSPDRCRLEARFHWLKQYKHNGRVHPMFRAQNIYPKDSAGKNIKLFNCATEHKLCSGDLFYFETSDPEELPLPSFALLQMQQRIAALSGVAEANGEADPDDSEDDPSNAIYDVEMEDKQSLRPGQGDHFPL